MKEVRNYRWSALTYILSDTADTIVSREMTKHGSHLSKDARDLKLNGTREYVTFIIINSNTRSVTGICTHCFLLPEQHKQENSAAVCARNFHNRGVVLEIRRLKWLYDHVSLGLWSLLIQLVVLTQKTSQSSLSWSRSSVVWEVVCLLARSDWHVEHFGLNTGRNSWGW